MNSRLLKIGYVVKPHGIKGLLCVNIYKKYNLEIGQKLFLEKLSDFCGPFEITLIQKHKNFLLLTTKEIKSIAEAEKFSGYSVGIQVKKLPENVFWIEDLIGCDVLSVKNKKLGKVEDFFKSGSTDIYVVRSADNKEFLIPFKKEIVKKIDIPGKTIVIEPLPGMLE